METEAIAALPDDAIAGVLRLLPPRSLAVCRCVCKAWHAIVDGRALLLPHLLPRTVRGIFLNYTAYDRPHHFTRPSAPSTFPKIDGMLDFLPREGVYFWWVLDHCNGLLLCDLPRMHRDLCVCNPATRRWTLLPRHTLVDYDASVYLAFDPAMSPHYEVFLIPDMPRKPDPCGLMEWPPSPWKLNVFLSRTGRWEDRSFIREGEPAGIVQDMWQNESSRIRVPRPQRYAVYCHGMLYVHCRGWFLTRFSLSNDSYQVIKMPARIEYQGITTSASFNDTKPYLGRSKNGVHFGFVYDCQLQVWILSESRGQMEWVLRYEKDLRPYAQQIERIIYQTDGVVMDRGFWFTEEADTEVHKNVETLPKDSFNSDSSDDDVFIVKVGSEEYFVSNVELFGFHPYKEIVFVAKSFGVIAYHLETSKVQYLGYARPKCYGFRWTNGIYESFVYTPCLIGELDGDTTRTGTHVEY